MNLFIVIHIIVLCWIMYLATISTNRSGRLVWAGNPLFIVIAIYLTSAVASLFVPESMLSGFDYSKYQASHYITYTLLISLSLVPIVFLKGRTFTLVGLAPKKYVNILFFFSSILIWFAFFYQLPYALIAFTIGAEDIRHGLNVLNEFILPPTIWTTIAVVVSSFYVVFVVMFFYSLANRMSIIYTVSTFAGGVLYVISSMCFTARDGPVFYVLTVLFAYIMFRGDLSKSVRKKLSLALVIVGCSILVFLVTFTVQRFSGSGKSDDLLSGTLGYIGQQPYVFAEALVSQDRFYGFDLRLPLIPIITTGSEPEVIRTLPFEWSFGTFLKDYYGMFGWFSLLSITIGQFAFFFLQFKKIRPPGSIYLILLTAFYFQFMLSGVFYFRLGTRGGNLYMVLYVLILMFSLYRSRLPKYSNRI